MRTGVVGLNLTFYPLKKEPIMKKIFLIAAGLSLGGATTSCSLEKFPETMYAENNTSGTGDSETAINTRELLEGQLTAMYNYMKGDLQTYW